MATILAEALRDKKFVDTLTEVFISLSENPEVMRVLSELPAAVLARPEVLKVRVQLHSISLLLFS